MKHNMAEIEIGELKRQCLHRRTFHIAPSNQKVPTRKLLGMPLTG